MKTKMCGIMYQKQEQGCVSANKKGASFLKKDGLNCNIQEKPINGVEKNEPTTMGLYFSTTTATTTHLNLFGCDMCLLSSSSRCL
jgi:hypothetical protein